MHHLFLSLNWVATQWLAQNTGRSGPTGWLLLLGGAIVGAAGLGTLRSPLAGAWAGITLAVLLGVGLLIGNPRDIVLPGGGWDPASILRHGAQQPLLYACAGCLLAVGFGVRALRS